MAILEFELESVLKLASASREAALRSPNMAQLFEKALMKPGTKPDQYGMFKASDVDPTKIEPALWLVKDWGIYLMSNAANQPMVEGSVPVVYAKGLGKDADYEAIRAAAGGDDFAEVIPLRWVEMAHEAGATSFRIKLTSKSLEFVPPAPASTSPSRRKPR